MSTSFTTGNPPGETIQPPYRFAYTINNEQPVICTLIGNEPLFYMDYEYEEAEEELFEAEFMGLLEKEMIKLERNIKRYDEPQILSKTYDEKNVYEDFLLGHGDLTSQFQAKAENPKIESLLEAISSSRYAATLIEIAHEKGVKFIFNAQEESARYTDEKIILNPSMDKGDQLLLLARELGRFYADMNGGFVHPLKVEPDQAVLLNRVQMSVLSLTMVRVAWELQLAGQDDAWNRVETGGMADLGRAYARECFTDFRNNNNGEAATALIETWFLSERCKHEDKILIQAMLNDYNGYVFSEPDESMPSVATIIAALGNVPYGKNFLVDHLEIIMLDPVFTEVRDRSNANFLWFVKFERTFRDTEQELQLNPAPFIGDIRLPVKTQQNQGQGYEQLNQEDGQGGNFGQVVDLFTEKAKQRFSQNDTSSNRGNGGAEIIYFRNRMFD